MMCVKKKKDIWVKIVRKTNSLRIRVKREKNAVSIHG